MVHGMGWYYVGRGMLVNKQLINFSLSKPLFQVTNKALSPTDEYTPKWLFINPITILQLTEFLLKQALIITFSFAQTVVN